MVGRSCPRCGIRMWEKVDGGWYCHNCNYEDTDDSGESQAKEDMGYVG